MTANPVPSRCISLFENVWDWLPQRLYNPDIKAILVIEWRLHEKFINNLGAVTYSADTIVIMKVLIPVTN